MLNLRLLDERMSEQLWSEALEFHLLLVCLVYTFSFASIAIAIEYEPNVLLLEIPFF